MWTANDTQAPLLQYSFTIIVVVDMVTVAMAITKEAGSAAAAANATDCRRQDQAA